LVGCHDVGSADPFCPVGEDFVRGADGGSAAPGDGDGVTAGAGHGGVVVRARHRCLGCGVRKAIGGRRPCGDGVAEPGRCRPVVVGHVPPRCWSAEQALVATRLRKRRNKQRQHPLRLPGATVRWHRQCWCGDPTW
jgi:hypothetical protein